MKKLLLALALTFAVAGCTPAIQKVTDGISTIVVGVQNPIGKKELYALENSMIVGFAGLNAYKRTCIAGAISQSCRDVIKRLQTYTRRIPPALARLRSFVRNNDRVNAFTAYYEVKALIDSFKAEATANGVSVR